MIKSKSLIYVYKNTYKIYYVDDIHFKGIGLK